MWCSGQQFAGHDVDWKFRNDANCDATWTEVDDAFKRLQVRQPDAEQPAAPTDPVESRENQRHNAASSFFVDALERQPQPRVSQTRDSNTINDLDAHRLFLGRCNGAERLYKVFCLISSPGADDTSWGPLQCSEAQVAAYERAITLSTQVAVLAQSVPDAYITPSTDILRRLVAPARDHIAALDSGVPLVWDRPRIKSTFSPALLQAALDSSLVRSPSVPAPAWTPLFGSAPSMHDAGVKDNKSTGSHSAAAGGRRKAAVPHVNGITSWKGPPLQLDAAARKRMRLKFLEMLRNSPSARRHDADRAAEAPPAAPAAAAAGPDGRTGGSLAELTAGPSRSGSLQSASSAMHVQPGQWSRGLPSSAALPLPLPQASRTNSYHELLGDGSSAPLPQRDLPPPAPPLQVHFEPGHTLPASRPGMRHDTNALCGSSRWEPQQPLPFHGSNAPGPLGWQLLAANRMPSGPPPRGDPLNAHPPFRFPDSTGLGIDNWGYNGCPSTQDPMVPPALGHGDLSGHLPLHGDLRPEGLGGHGASGPHTGPPAVPPQDMAKLMLRVAQQLGYPPQRMQEVVSCMQRDCRQPGPGAEWW